MGMNATARGLSALSGFGLFLTAIVLCYLNSTTSSPTMSTVFVAGIVISSLSMAAKWAVALDVQTTVVEYADKMASVVPWIALYFVGTQALHFSRDGMDGLMAGISIIALVFLAFFGVLDSIGSFIGKKYHDVADGLSDFSHRVSDAKAAASDAFSGRN